MSDDSKDLEKPKKAKKPKQQTPKANPVLNGHWLQPGHVLYDADHWKDLHEREGRIDALTAKSDENRWKEGDEYWHVKLNKLYIQAGFNGMEAYILSRGKDPKTINRRIAFSTRFTLDDVKAYGKSLLDKALEYANLAGIPDKKWSAGSLRVVVPGAPKPVPFAKITMPEMRLALDHQYENHARRLLERIHPEVRSKSEVLRAAVTTETGTLAKVDVRQPKDGTADDATFVIEVRHNDLMAVLTRMLEALERRRGRGR